MHLLYEYSLCVQADLGVDNRELNAVNAAIRSHPVEVVGMELRGYMTDMEKISTGG